MEKTGGGNFVARKFVVRNFVVGNFVELANPEIPSSENSSYLLKLTAFTKNIIYIIQLIKMLIAQWYIFSPTGGTYEGFIIQFKLVPGGELLLFLSQNY